MYRATAQGNVELSPEEEIKVLAEWGTHNSLQNKKNRLKQIVAEYRFKHEAKGIIVNGVNVRTDDYAQSRITRALSYVARKNTNIAFKDAKGDFVTLNTAQLDSIFDAVGDYIQACYAAEKAHCEAINALTEENIDSYDITANWP